MPGKLFTGIVSESGAKHTRGLAKAGESVRWLGLVGFVIVSSLQLIPQNLQRGQFLARFSRTSWRQATLASALWKKLNAEAQSQGESEVVLSFNFEDAQAFEVTGSCIHYHMIHLRGNKI